MKNVLAVMAVLALTGVAAAQFDQLALNELYISHSGTDDREFIEIVGPGGMALTNIYILAVESDAGTTTGNVDDLINLSLATMPADGYFVAGNTAVANLDFDIGASNILENSTTTFYLVEETTPGGVAALAGTNVDDGTMMGTTIISTVANILDVVCYADGGITSGDVNYDGSTIVGPEAGASFSPAGIYRGNDFPSQWCLQDFLDFDVVANMTQPRTPGAPNVGCPSKFTLSQSIDDTTITTFNSISCNSGAPDFFHTDNSYLRYYNLTGEGEGAASITITDVRFAIEEAVAATGSQPLEIRIYETATGATSFGGFTLLHTESFSVADGNNIIRTQAINPPLVVANDPTKDIVVEIFTPDGQTAGNRLFIGSNTAGETAGSFIAAGDCGIADSTDLDALGFTGMNIIADLCYAFGMPQPPTYLGTGEDFILEYSQNGGATTGISFSTENVALATNDTLELTWSSPSNTFVGDGIYFAVGSLVLDGTLIPEVGAGTSIYVDVTGGAFVADGLQNIAGNPVQLPMAGSSVFFTYPGGAAAATLVFQGFVATGTAANGTHVASNGLIVDLM